MMTEWFGKNLFSNYRLHIYNKNGSQVRYLKINNLDCEASHRVGRNKEKPNNLKHYTILILI